MLSYQSHKIVDAAKITAVLPNGGSGGATVRVEGGPTVYEEIVINEATLSRIVRMANEAGANIENEGYLVRYEDGYVSWSPAAVFEAGYELLEYHEPVEHHPSVDGVLQFFEYSHLPEHLQAVSAPICKMAHQLANTLPQNPELTVALRKLLESKDAAVRALLSV